MVDYMNLEYATPPPEEPPTLTALYGEEGRDWIPCPECGAVVPLPEQVLVVAGDYDAPAVYDYPVDTVPCPGCRKEVWIR